MRDLYHLELDRLDEDVVRMGALIETAIEEATLALIEGDIERARRVMEGDDAIDEMFLDLELRAMHLIAQQQPMAQDLRLIVAVLRVIHDLERSGDLAYNMAKVVKDNIPITRMKKVAALIYELGMATKRLTSKSLDAWSAKDVTLAAEMESLDDEIDGLYRQLLKELFDLQCREDLEEEGAFDLAMKLVLVGRGYERIADHAVNMGERIRYLVTGDEQMLA